MALNKTILSQALFDAETKNVDLTSEASKKIKDRCDAVASAIYDFVTSADILIDVYPGIPVATAGVGVPPGSPAAQSGATTGPGQGAAKEIF
tara:strand:+ start:147 stop:422 length:276 start_codon:yes stop_codon:yes gene_type:complete